MKLVTVATHSERYFPALQESCKKLDSELVILGWNEKWKGFGWKFNLVQNFLKTQPDNEIICFIDAYDVILLRSTQELEDQFKKTDGKIIVGHDKVQIFLQEFAAEIIFYKDFNFTRRERVNSGTYIGYVKDIKKILADIHIKDNEDDQIALCNYILKHKDKFTVDVDCDYFMTLGKPHCEFMTNDVRVENGKVFYKNSTPFIAHGAGMTNMDKFISLLGITIPDFNRFKAWIIYITRHFLISTILGTVLAIGLPWAIYNYIQPETYPIPVFSKPLEYLEIQS
jgi:hypothetical protein